MGGIWDPPDPGQLGEAQCQGCPPGGAAGPSHEAGPAVDPEAAAQRLPGSCALLQGEVPWSIPGTNAERQTRERGSSHYAHSNVYLESTRI